MFWGVFQTHVTLTKIRNVLGAQIMIRYYCLVTEKMLRVSLLQYTETLSPTWPSWMEQQGTAK